MIKFEVTENEDFLMVRFIDGNKSCKISLPWETIDAYMIYGINIGEVYVKTGLKEIIGDITGKEDVQLTKNDIDMIYNLNQEIKKHVHITQNEMNRRKEEFIKKVIENEEV